MRKGLFITFTLLLALAVVLAACSSSDAKNTKKPSPAVTRLESCDSLEKDWDQETCYITAALNSSNERYCDFIVDRTHNVCLFELSVAINDVDLCGAILNDTNWGDICYKNYAEKNANESFCSNVVYAGDRDTCFATVAVDTEQVGLCSKVKDVKKNQRCIFDLARETRNEKVCELLTNSLDQDVCYLYLAKLKGDGLLCDSIGYRDVRAECNKMFATVALNITALDATASK